MLLEAGANMLFVDEAKIRGYPWAFAALVHSIRCSVKAFQPRQKEFHERGD